MPKKAYVGVVTDVPIYEEKDGTVNITADNLADFFSVENGKYCFAWNGSGWVSNNGGVASSSATTVLTALRDLPSLSFGYYYSSEKGYDKFTLKVGGTTVEAGASGSKTNKTWSGSLAKGKTIELTYTKDSSGDSYDDKCGLYSLTFTGKTLTQVGSEKKSIAREIKRIFVGVKGTVPVYTTEAAVTITGNNYSSYFEKIDDKSGYFAEGISNPYGTGKAFSTGRWDAASTFYAKYDMTVTTKTTVNRNDYAGTTMTAIANGDEIGSSGAFTLNMKKGQPFRIEWYAGKRPDVDDDEPDPESPDGYLYITCTNVKKQSGTEMKEAARDVVKGYIGVNGVARQFFAKSAESLDIAYTGKYTDKVVTMDNKQYRLLTLTSSGTLVLPKAIEADIWMCGGGTSGAPGVYVGSSHERGWGGGGGGGAYFGTYLNRTLTEGRHTAIIGSGGSGGSNSRGGGETNSNYTGAYSGGGTSSLDSMTHAKLSGGKVQKLTGISGASGGGAGYAYYAVSSSNRGAQAASGGSGGGASTIPFGSSYFEPHCSGGNGGGQNNYNSQDDNDRNHRYNGKYGGENGADGGSFSMGDTVYESNTVNPSATIYGSGGNGGWASTDMDEKDTSSASGGGSGVQGVIYIRIPL